MVILKLMNELYNISRVLYVHYDVLVKGLIWSMRSVQKSLPTQLIACLVRTGALLLPLK